MGKSKKAKRQATAETISADDIAEAITTAPTRETRNGVKRPGPGKCLEVWEYLDQHGDMTAKDLKPVADEKGWNRNNCLIELYQWRKHNGITRTATK